MARKYVCNPKTGRVIEVDGSTYKQAMKNPADKRKLERSPKNSSKKKLRCLSPRRKKKTAKRRRRRARAKCGNHEGSTAPSSDERKHIAETCGEEGFLGDNMTFAVLNAECNHSPLRNSAACIRARQLASRNVKGRSKAYYNRIAQRARALRNAEQERPPPWAVAELDEPERDDKEEEWRRKSGEDENCRTLESEYNLQGDDKTTKFKKYWRKTALQIHPDKCSSPKCAEDFKKLNNDYHFYVDRCGDDSSGGANRRKYNANGWPPVSPIPLPESLLTDPNSNYRGTCYWNSSDCTPEFGEGSDIPPPWGGSRPMTYHECYHQQSNTAQTPTSWKYNQKCFNCQRPYGT